MKNSAFNGSRVLAFLIACTFLTATPLAAAPLDWHTLGTGNWFQPSNWSGNTVPTAADSASVNNGGTAEADSDQALTARALGIGSGAGDVLGTVTTQTADLQLGFDGALNVGLAFGPAANAEGRLAVGGSIVGIPSSTSFNSFSIGRAEGDNSKAIGSVVVEGDVTAFQGFVGVTGAGDGLSANGTLTVGRDLTGLVQVGVGNVSTNATATGSVTVASGDLTLGQGGFSVGQTFGLGTTATGVVTVEKGKINTTSTLWAIGSAIDGTAEGRLEAAGVDSTGAALTGLRVGGTADGNATGTLALGSGDLRVAGNALIGTASVTTGSTAQGTVSLGGALAGEGPNRILRVGSAGGGFEQSAPGSAEGSLSAEGALDIRTIFIGSAGGSAGIDLEATGTLNVGARGIVNIADPGNVLAIGRAEAQSVNLQLRGPGPVATGAATVAGDIAGYFVDVGFVQNTGTATGSLALGTGTMTTTGLRIGVVAPPVIDLAATDAVGTAAGVVEVTDGAVVVTAPSFGPFGVTEIGRVIESGHDFDHSAKGTMVLTNSSFESGIVSLGSGRGGEGTLLATDSTVAFGNMSVGFQGGTGRVTLADSTTLTAKADEFLSGSLSLRGTDTALTATDSTVSLDGNLAIMTGGAVGDTARMTMVGGTLSVGQGVGIGQFSEGSRGELSLTDTAATVGGNVRIGQSANNGALFGEALLHLDASLMDITGALFLDIGGELSFGIGGLLRGLGGYGALNAGSATLLGGRAKVDFAGLVGSLGFLSAEFDLISVTSGFTGDFELVSLLNIPTGYFASHGFTDAGDAWRVTLTRDLAPIPLPASGWLLLSAFSGIVLLRRRRPL